ncbi:MAG: hypothetical protein AAGD12_07050, partial [Pseudomonadota bacterium]
MSRKRRDFSISAPPGQIAPAAPAEDPGRPLSGDGAARSPAAGQAGPSGMTEADAPGAVPPHMEPPVDAPRRRGPMAAAVHETALASQARAEQAAAIRAENDALAA